MGKKRKLAEIAASKPARRIMLGLGILFIILTFFIAVTPDSFLKFGYPGIFAFNTISSGLLIFPIIAKKFNIFGVVLASALGNALNASINYLVGYASSGSFAALPFVTTLKKWMKRFGLIIVYILAVTPLPLDVGALLSGYLNISYRKYILVNFLGKVTLFLLVSLGVISFAKITHK